MLDTGRFAASFLPAGVAIIVGIVLAVRRRRVEPTVSRPAILGLALLLLSVLVSSLTSPVLRSLVTSGTTLGTIGTISSVIAAAVVLLTIGGWVFVLVALFRRLPVAGDTAPTGRHALLDEQGEQVVAEEGSSLYPAVAAAGVGGAALGAGAAWAGSDEPAPEDEPFGSRRFASPPTVEAVAPDGGPGVAPADPTGSSGPDDLPTEVVPIPRLDGPADGTPDADEAPVGAEPVDPASPEGEPADPDADVDAEAVVGEPADAGDEDVREIPEDEVEDPVESEEIDGVETETGSDADAEVDEAADRAPDQAPDIVPPGRDGQDADAVDGEDDRDDRDDEVPADMAEPAPAPAGDDSETPGDSTPGDRGAGDGTPEAPGTAPSPDGPTPSRTGAAAGAAGFAALTGAAAAAWAAGRSEDADAAPADAGGSPADAVSPPEQAVPGVDAAEPGETEHDDARTTVIDTAAARRPSPGPAAAATPAAPGPDGSGWFQPSAHDPGPDVPAESADDEPDTAEHARFTDPGTPGDADRDGAPGAVAGHPGDATAGDGTPAATRGGATPDATSDDGLPDGPADPDASADPGDPGGTDDPGAAHDADDPDRSDRPGGPGGSTGPDGSGGRNGSGGENGSGSDGPVTPDGSDDPGAGDGGPESRPRQDPVERNVAPPGRWRRLRTLRGPTHL